MSFFVKPFLVGVNLRGVAVCLRLILLNLASWSFFKFSKASLFLIVNLRTKRLATSYFIAFPVYSPMLFTDCSFLKSSADDIHLLF